MSQEFKGEKSKFYLEAKYNPPNIDAIPNTDATAPSKVVMPNFVKATYKVPPPAIQKTIARAILMPSFVIRFCQVVVGS